MERKCSTPNCKIVEPLMLIGESFICGKCFMVWYRKNQNKFLNEIIKAGEKE